jgi:hypothetical protein
LRKEADGIKLDSMPGGENNIFQFFIKGLIKGPNRLVASFNSPGFSAPISGRTFMLKRERDKQM